MATGGLETQLEETEAKRVEGARREFLSGIGKCITFWAGIEAALSDLFFIVLATNIDYANYIFWSIPTFSMRLSYTSGILEIYFKDKDKRHIKEWRILQARLSDLYSIRNKLAHQPVTEDTYIKKTTDDGNILILEVLEENPKVIPNQSDKKQKFDPIDNAMLNKHYAEISNLDFDLNNFIGEISAMHEQELFHKGFE